LVSQFIPHDAHVSLNPREHYGPIGSL